MSSSSKRTHYALTYGKAEPLEAPQQQDGGDDVQMTRSQLAQVYQSYAELYPNPHLVEEFLQRDRILAEVRQEMEEERRLAEEANPELAKAAKSKQSGGGFFGFLLGRSKNVAPEVRFQEDDINPEDYLIYADAIEADDERHNTGSLCGTHNSTLDVNCIPTEAHSVARLHLSSPSLPIPVSRQGGPILLIVGLGVLAELVDDEWNIVETSDKQDLEDYVAAQSGHGYHLQHSRSTLIGPNCLAISWGLQDGLTILYRRVEGFRPATLGWDAVALVAPTRAVLDNLQAVSDVFLQNSDGSLSSQLLRVTAVASLLVETEGIPAATLVVSRLGGYMELLPLPAQLWHGPILTPKIHKRQASSPRKKKRNAAPQHYAMGHLYNIASEEHGIAALTVSEHLDDLLDVQVFRTPVSIETEWDNAAFPDSPPAEYLMVASGSKDGEERITFWAVATIFSDNPNEGFAIHVGFLEEYSIGSIGQVTLFASNKIMEHWRRPRRVMRRQKGQIENDSEDLTESKSMPLGTLSAQAPTVSMRFKVVARRIVLSVLDWNGGVSLLDCTAVVKKASQTLTREELEFFGESILTTSLLSRDESRRCVNGGMVVDMEWSARGELVLVTSNNKLHVLVVDSESGCATSSVLSLPRSGPGTAKLIEGNNLSLLLPRKSGSMLQTVDLQPSSPTSMIERLMNASKFSEALEAAEAFPEKESVRVIVTTCHTHLWEQRRLVDSLAAIPDDVYVIEQVMAIFRGDSKAKDLDVTSCHRACQLALERCTTLRVASALQLSDELDTFKAKLAGWCVRAGTYSLLCRHLVASENIDAFFDTFLNGPLVGLASQMAAQGDMRALTFLLFRHRKELAGDRMAILDQVPLSVDPVEYSHLLPIIKGEHCVDIFLTVNETLGIRKCSTLFYVAEEELGYSLLVDGEDPVLFSQNQSPSEQIGRGDVASWFVQRGRQMQKTVGTLPLLLNACELAIRCIGPSSPSLPGNADMETLVEIKAFAQHFDEILCSADLSSSSEVELLQASTEDLAEMPMEKLVSMLLGMPRTEREASSRFSKHVLPVLSMPGISEVDKSDEGVLNDKLDDALTAFCMDLLTTKFPETGSGTKAVRSIREAMATCVAVLKASRSSLPKQKRLIKSRNCLMRLFLSLTDELSRSCSKLKLLPSDARDLIGKLWKLYECLPATLAPHETSARDLVKLKDRVDTYFLSLIAADLLSNWSPDRSMGLLSVDGLNGPQIASDMCEFFCKDVGSNHKSLQAKINLVHGISSDLIQLQTEACNSSFDLEPILHRVLLMGLLQQGEFQLFVEVFSTELGGIANWERMQPAVLGFVNEAMFGDANDSTSRFSFETDKVHAAIQCQDILGSRFPQLQTAFMGMRRHLDAAHFINTVLCPDNANLNPSELRDMLPFDVVEHVLEENPMCILQGCDDWASADFGRAKNRELWSYFHFRDDPDVQTNMPPLPGGAVFHLANIVGLESPAVHLILQNRVVQYAKIASLPWVGAAIALSIVSEKSEQPEENALRLDTAELVVSDDAYDDIIVKSLLCRGALSLVPFQSRSSLPSVIMIFAELEHKVSRFCPVSWERDASTKNQSGHPISPTQAGSDFLVFRAAGMLANTAKTMIYESGAPLKQNTLLDRELVPRPIDRVFQDTLRGYSADLNSLFQILQDKASKGEEDDALLIAVGRFFVFWCISNSVGIIEHENQGTPKQADAFENLALSCSLLMHSKDKESVLSNITEMKEIAESQSIGAIEQVAAHPRLNPLRPDLAIVRKLIGLGYSENGARRAAVITNNESQEAAMLWAVAHSLEPSFNAPLIFVKPTRNPMVDQNAIRNVKKFLYTIDSYFNGTMPLHSTTRASESQSEDVDFAILAHTLSPPEKKRVPPKKADKPAQLRPPPPKLPTKMAMKAAESPEKSAPRPQTRSMTLKAPQKLTRQAPPAPKQVTATAATQGLDKKPPQQKTTPPLPKKEPLPLTSATGLQKTTQRAPTPPPPAPQVKKPPVPQVEKPPIPEVEKPQVPQVEAPKREPPPSPMRQPTPPPAAPPLPPQIETIAASPALQPSPRSAPAILDRSTLKRAGEFVRKQSRGISNTLNHDERKRLLSKGRQLFEHQRSSPTNLISSRSGKPATSLINGTRLRTTPAPPAPPRVVPPPRPAAPKPTVVEASIEEDIDADAVDGWDFDDF